MTYFVIELEGELVGSIALVPQTDVYRKSTEIGYWIGEPYWGKGIATEAIRQILDFGFKNLDIVRIFTGIYGHNLASQKVLEKKWLSKRGCFQKSRFQKREVLR